MEKCSNTFSETHRPSSPRSQSRLHYASPQEVFVAADLGQWFHCVVVYDSASGEVNFFRNGIQTDSMPIKETRPIGIGMADLGNWPYKEWALGTKWEVRHLDGLMDEFFVLGRAMAAG